MKNARKTSNKTTKTGTYDSHEDNMDAPEIGFTLLQSAFNNYENDTIEVTEEEEEEKKGSGVVKAKYKARYAERGDPRGCGDWLQQTLKEYTLDQNGKLRVAELEAILDANGVKHAHWNRTTPGWQGRLRMSGGMALRTKVANQFALILPDGTELEAPVRFCDKHMSN
jgi:hypothetical protein